MNKLETFGFVISILISLYLVREVRELKNATLQRGEERPTEDKKPENVTDETENGGLTRLQGFRVGHEQKVDIGNGRTLTLITRALRPLTFEIPNFLNDDEIEYMVNKAKQQNLITSEAKSGLDKKFVYVKNEGRKRAQPYWDNFQFWDVNNDGIIDIEELTSGMPRVIVFVTPDEEEVTNVFTEIFPVELEDGVITEDEWATMDTVHIEDKVNYWFAEDPRFMARHSEQTWLGWEREGILADLRQRVVKLTKLPKKIVYGGESIQVAHYYPKGHYHAHFDSETHLRSDLPCCHQIKAEVDGSGKCIICRLITIMTYMNDVEEGGETAFVYADNKTYTATVVSEKCNLSLRCKDANLVMKPKKGTAVFWYNHYVDNESNYLGERDGLSLHGGCDVIKGEKWISNIWLTAPYKNHKHLPSIYATEF
ncbi:transmembrane prolyl 4-hydroxylase-like [Rhopilema esculentum]|uniref:transmembrane prolyl 4-hydroxylase-like n=1 Tax=Rhopilema esculentum TaxID=499914 RepID=UPI0031D522F1